MPLREDKFTLSVQEMKDKFSGLQNRIELLRGYL